MPTAKLAPTPLTGCAPTRRIGVANGRATAGQPACKKKRRAWHRATAGTGRTGGCQAPHPPTPAISFGAKQAGRLLEPSTLAAGSSWHTDALPPQPLRLARAVASPSCAPLPPHGTTPASIPEARRLSVQRHRTAPGLLPRAPALRSRTFLMSSHLSARTSVQFPVLGAEPMLCKGAGIGTLARIARVPASSRSA